MTSRWPLGSRYSLPANSFQSLGALLSPQSTFDGAAAALGVVWWAAGSRRTR